MINILSNLLRKDTKKIKLTIQNGHRNNPKGQTGTTGVTSDGRKFNEVDLIDQIYYVIKKKIDADSLLSKVILLAYDDANITNAGDSDYFVALHADAAFETIRGGFIDNNPNDLVYEESMKFAKSVSDLYFTSIGIPYRNGQTPNSTYYYGFAYTGPQTKQFIIELGNMKNKEDIDKMVDVEYVGHLVLEGMKNYWKENDPIYKYALENNTIDNDKDRRIAELERGLQELRNETQRLLAEKDREVLKVLENYKNDVRKKLEKHKNNLDSIISSL